MAEVVPQRQLVPVFECLNQFIERKTVAEHCISGVEMRHMGQAAAADFAPRRG